MASPSKTSAPEQGRRTPASERSRRRLAPNFYGETVSSQETKNIERDDVLIKISELSARAESLSKSMMEDNLNYLTSNQKWDEIVTSWEHLKTVVVDFTEASSTNKDDKSRVDLAVEELGTELGTLYEEIKTNEATQRLLNIQRVAERNSDRGSISSPRRRAGTVIYTPAPSTFIKDQNASSTIDHTNETPIPDIKKENGEKRDPSPAESRKTRSSKISSRRSSVSRKSTTSSAAVARAEANKAKLKLEQTKKQQQLQAEIEQQNRKLELLKLQDDVELQENFAKELEEAGENDSIFGYDDDGDIKPINLPSFPRNTVPPATPLKRNTDQKPDISQINIHKNNSTNRDDAPIKKKLNFNDPKASLINPPKDDNIKQNDVSIKKEEANHVKRNEVPIKTEVVFTDTKESRTDPPDNDTSKQKYDRPTQSHITSSEKVDVANCHQVTDCVDQMDQSNQLESCTNADILEKATLTNDLMPTFHSVSAQDRTVKLMYLNTIDPVKFSGSPRDFPEFKKRINAMLDDGILNDSEKVELLPKFLTGDPLLMLKRLQGRSYSSIVSRLEERYGHPTLVANSFISDLISGSNIQANDRTGLQMFADLLTTAAESLEGNYFVNASCAPNMLKITDRLPQYMKNEWEKKVVDICEKKGAPDIRDLAEFVDKAARAKNNPFYQSAPVHSNRDTDNAKRPLKVMAAGLDNDEDVHLQCRICEGVHVTAGCTSIKSMEDPEKFQAFKRKGLCYICTQRYCKAQNCPKRKNGKLACQDCERPHSKLLPCRRITPKPSKPQEDRDSHGLSCGAVNLVREPHYDYMLSLMPVRIHGKNQKSITTYAFPDGGSKGSFLDESIADYLGLTSGTVEIRKIHTVVGTQPQRLRKENFEVSNISTGERTLVKHQSFVMVGVNLGEKLSEKHLPEDVNIEDFSHLKTLHIPEVDMKIIGVMLGLQVFHAHEAIRYHRGKIDEPFAVETRLGISLAGPVGHSNGETLLSVNCTKVMPTDTEDPMIDTLGRIERLWSLDDYATSHPKHSLSRANQRAVEIFDTTLVHRDDLHYQSGLLWFHPNIVLPFNRSMAKRRLKAVLKRFESDPEFARMYCKSMSVYIMNDLGSMMTSDHLKLSRSFPRNNYLPHSGVTNPNKPGDLRIVYDAGAEYEGTSLNKNLMSGPDSSCSLIGVFLRGRVAVICICGDIKGMFNMCYVSPEDRDALRFLWFDEHGKIRDFRMNVHVFGATDSPFAANRMLKQIALDNQEHFDEDIIKIVLRNFYVDDTLFNAKSTSDGIRMAIGLKELLARGGMKLTKFSSNSKDVLKALQREDLASPEINIDLDPLPTARALGLMWNTETDCLGFKMAKLNTPNTLRGATSHIARIFDPLGITAPVMLPGKVIIQELWKRKMKWDQEMPEDVLKPWLEWKGALHHLEDLQLPRRFFSELQDCRTDLKRLEMHLFADSSGYATGAAVYLRGIDHFEKIHVSSLVFGKSKLLPIKPKLYTPRNEMKAAVDIVRIAQKLDSELDLQIDEKVYWTDSEIVLAYIKNETKTFHAFIANRQSEIRMYTTAAQWRHCRTDLNVSDDPSRGVNAAKLTSKHRYITGPKFLTTPETDWPITHVEDIPDEDPEVKTTIPSFCTVVGENVDKNTILLLTEKKSSYISLCRTVAWMCRWKTQLDKVTLTPGLLSLGEVTHAEIVLVQLVQHQFYAEEIESMKAKRCITKSNILDLHPFLDEHSIVRAKGRLQNATGVAYTTKHPIILPSPTLCRLSKIIIEHYHRKLAHGGQELMMGCLREQYWIACARSYVRMVIRMCIICRKRNARPGEQIMGDLPPERLMAFHPAFSQTGTDCFGPITCKDRRRTISMYGVIFLCLTTKAIHIEAVSSLDTNDFIQGLLRFVALRGKVDRIRSDNGSNYLGAERALRELVNAWNERQITDVMTVKGVDWKFQAPLASSMSGIWERRVKETKRHLYAILHNTEPTIDVFRTLLYEVANIMNQAPLCAVSNDPESYEVLTPAHFLFQRPASTIAPVPAEEGETGRYKKQWRTVQFLADCYWRRWLKEYVPTLLPRSKWIHERRNLQVDDLVLITNMNLPRSRWVFGRIIETIPDKEGKVRHARVKTQDSEYLRPIQRLAIVAERELNVVP